MKIRALGASDIRSLVSAAELIPLMRQTMAAVSRGEALLPLRTGLRLPGNRGALVTMPGHLAPARFAGIKLIGLAPRATPERASHPGLMLLFDENGVEPVAMLNGSTVTAMRTAAATA